MHNNISITLSHSSQWKTQDLGEQFVHRSPDPFPSIAIFPSLDDRTVLTTIISRNTLYPSGKLQREGNIASFPLHQRFAPEHCGVRFKHNNHLRNITRSNCNLHVIFPSADCPLENNIQPTVKPQQRQKKVDLKKKNIFKKTSNRFLIWDHTGRVVSPRVVHRTCAVAASLSSSARQRQLGECSPLFYKG